MSVSRRRGQGIGQLTLATEVPDAIWGGELADVVSAAVALGAASFGGPLSYREARLARQASPKFAGLDALREAIRSGDDPLGEAISAARTPTDRRNLGAFYTPAPIVRSMVDWTLARGPSRLVDPGCGSGRFTAQAVRADPDLEILAVDVDPVATVACRAVLRVLGAKRAQVINADYTTLRVARHQGRTAFVGNPPYVRHHQLTAKQKSWAKNAAASLGLHWSGLAGLHAHFFLATLLHSRKGDLGCFITSAEWLDIGYGQGVRQALLDGMGVVGLHRIDPQAATFDDAMTTAVVTCFEAGSGRGSIRVRTARSARALADLDSGGRLVSRARLRGTSRWTRLFVERTKHPLQTTVPLGELVRVSRGAVTGANRYFVLSREHAEVLSLTAWMVPVLTGASEILGADGIVKLTPARRALLDPPRDLDLTCPDCESLHRYLRMGERGGIANGYICRHRNPWWHVGAKRPPVVATYMARQPPAFALNPDGLAILNVLHGLFPRVELDDKQLTGLVRFLNTHRETFRGAGRTYQGGLEKFEPREMEALEVPPPERLRAYAAG